MALFESIPSVMGRLAADATNNTTSGDQTASTRTRYPSLSHRRGPSSHQHAPWHQQQSSSHRGHPGRRPSTSAQTRTTVSFDASVRHRPSAYGSGVGAGHHGCYHHYHAGNHPYTRPERRHNREGVGTILGVGTSLVARDYAALAHAQSTARSVPTAIPDLAPELLFADEKTLRDEPLFDDEPKADMDVADKLDLLLKQNAAIWSRIATLESRQTQIVRAGMIDGVGADLPFGLSRPPSPSTSSSGTLKTRKSAIERFHCGHLSDDVTYVRQRENALVLSIVAFIMVLVIALVWLIVPLGPHISPVFSTGSSLVWSCLSSWLSLRLLEGYRGWGEPD